MGSRWHSHLAEGMQRRECPMIGAQEDRGLWMSVLDPQRSVLRVGELIDMGAAEPADGAPSGLAQRLVGDHVHLDFDIHHHGRLYGGTCGWVVYEVLLEDGIEA